MYRPAQQAEQLAEASAARQAKESKMRERLKPENSDSTSTRCARDWSGRAWCTVIEAAEG